MDVDVVHNNRHQVQRVRIDVVLPRVRQLILERHAEMLIFFRALEAVSVCWRHTVALAFQRIVRGFLGRLRWRRVFSERLRHLCAVTIQAAWRGRDVRTRIWWPMWWKYLNHRATQLAATWRMWCERKCYLHRRAARRIWKRCLTASRIQAVWRGWRARRILIPHVKAEALAQERDWMSTEVWPAPLLLSVASVEQHFEAAGFQSRNALRADVAELNRSEAYQEMVRLLPRLPLNERVKRDLPLLEGAFHRLMVASILARGGRKGCGKWSTPEAVGTFNWRRRCFDRLYLIDVYYHPPDPMMGTPALMRHATHAQLLAARAMSARSMSTTALDRSTTPNVRTSSAATAHLPSSRMGSAIKLPPLHSRSSMSFRPDTRSAPGTATQHGIAEEAAYDATSWLARFVPRPKQVSVFHAMHDSANALLSYALHQEVGDAPRTQLRSRSMSRGRPRTRSASSTITSAEASSRQAANTSRQLRAMASLASRQHTRESIFQSRLSSRGERLGGATAEPPPLSARPASRIVSDWDLALQDSSRMEHMEDEQIRRPFALGHEDLPVDMWWVPAEVRVDHAVECVESRPLPEDYFYSIDEPVVHAARTAGLPVHEWMT
ncbi:hypothetical protein EON62_02955, partial [archaeon]